MHPSGYDMEYDYEWPKTAADLVQLLSMESFDLFKIYKIDDTIDGKHHTRGIKFEFHGES